STRPTGRCGRTSGCARRRRCGRQVVKMKPRRSWRRSAPSSQLVETAIGSRARGGWGGGNHNFFGGGVGGAGGGGGQAIFDWPRGSGGGGDSPSPACRSSAARGQSL